jgi:hypothetical protein
MSAFRPSGGGSGGGIDPAQLAALVDDNESINLYGGIVSTVHQRADALADAISNARVDILGSMSSAGLPAGYLAEFPADQVPAGWEVVQGTPESIPTGIGTVSASRSTGQAQGHSGFAYIAQTNRLWSLYVNVLASLDLNTNRHEAMTYSVPFSPSNSLPAAVLHDMPGTSVLLTAGSNSNKSLGDARAFLFNTLTRTFTQVADFKLTTPDGFERSGLGGSSLRLSDGRIFWMPHSLIRTGSSTILQNSAQADGGYYFIYNPALNQATAYRFANWANAVGANGFGMAGSSGASGLQYSVPIAQLADGRIVIQELNGTSVSASRYFFIDLVANTLTQGTGVWTAGLWALAPHPQGLVAFNTGSTSRRYYNAQTDTMDAVNASTYSSASIGASQWGLCYKAFAIGNGNYALPGNTTANEAAALAFDSFQRLGTVKARKVA